MEKSRISRRVMLKGAAAAVLALDGSVSAVSSASAAEQSPLVQKTPVIGSKNVTGQKVEGSVAKVYFSPVIDAASLIKLYNLVNEEIRKSSDQAAYRRTTRTEYSPARHGSGSAKDDS